MNGFFFVVGYKTCGKMMMTTWTIYDHDVVVVVGADGQWMMIDYSGRYRSPFIDEKQDDNDDGTCLELKFWFSGYYYSWWITLCLTHWSLLLVSNLSS